MKDRKKRDGSKEREREDKKEMHEETKRAEVVQLMLTCWKFKSDLNLYEVSLKINLG